MIKKIPIAELRPGMYLHDAICGWRVEPIFSFRFKVADAERVERLRELGVREVYIDTALGDDLPGAPTEEEVRRALEDELVNLAAWGELPTHHRLAEKDEIATALAIHNHASGLIRQLMTDIRLGRQVEFDAIGEALRSIADSVLDNFGTLIQLGQLKTADDYTFQHCVSVCALLTGFCRLLEFNRQTTYDVGIGALLHDVGKMRVPLEILNKPGRLSNEEFDAIKLHVAHGCDIVAGVPWVGATALNVISHHHERFDGTGYPAGLRGTEISYVGQMAAIVDVYDAITAERVYHRAMEPAEALRKLHEWSRFHFNEELVAHFIRSIGIYPVRTAVNLESGLIGIVLEQNPADLARPVLLAVFDARKDRPLAPYRVDLATDSWDRILGYVNPEHYGIDVGRCLQAA